MSNATNAVPDGWIVAPLQAVVTLRSERVSPKALPDLPYIGMEHVEPHTNRIIQTLPASSVTSSSARFWADDVLYGRMRPYLNKVAQPKFAGLASAEFMVFAFSEDLHPNYLRMRLTSADFVEFSLGQISGDRPRVKFEQLRDFAFALPPICEQHRIVEKLEELLSDLDAGVAELRAAQAKLKLYRQSLLKAAVTGELTGEWRKRQRLGGIAPRGAETELHSSMDLQSDSALRALPEGWCWTCAEQLCGFITKGTTPPKELKGAGEEAGVPFLRVTNLTANGSLDLSDKVFVTEAVHRGFLKRSIVYPGDVLMNIVGPPLGQVSVVPGSFGEWNVNQAIAIFRPTEKLTVSFLCAYLLSSVAQQWLQRRGKTTAGQTNLTLELCRNLPVPLPPLSEQLAISAILAEQLDALAMQEQEVRNALRQSEAQRKNILQAAFSGQLVPQDPNDEPASVLLARIRANRADKASAPTRRTRKAKEPA